MDKNCQPTISLILSTSNVRKMGPIIIKLLKDSGKEENLKSLEK